MAVVAEGEFAEGLRWVIEAEGADEQFSTMLIVRRGDQIVSGGGMGGPKLYGGELVNASYGITDDLPCTEVIRTHPSVDRVVVTTDRGSYVEAQLTETNAQFALRFGAVELPAGHLPIELRAESAGIEVHRESQGGLRPFGRDGFGEDGVFYGGGPR